MRNRDVALDLSACPGRHVGEPSHGGSVELLTPELLFQLGLTSLCSSSSGSPACAHQPVLFQLGLTSLCSPACALPARAHQPVLTSLCSSSSGSPACAHHCLAALEQSPLPFWGLRNAGAPEDTWQIPCSLGIAGRTQGNAPHFICEETETTRRHCSAHWKTVIWVLTD
uniref:Uncharacterized protein n=1 Tax=Molossus molossus TaxID=27622 RepID=A0A7J8FAN1_MOLMO|nr:hypothetical protein HJG59_008572 [Molossus molossus]